MATFNSQPRRAVKWPLAAAMILTAGILSAGEAEWKASAAYAGQEFIRARDQLQLDANNPTNAWMFARAAFDFAEFSTNDTQRASLARQGIAACRKLIAANPKIAAGHYYLAMNLGQLARTEFLGALRLVREMEREFQAAAKLDAGFDHAGPERNLGLLYREAPGWPISIGSRHESLPYSEQAARLARDYPENHLNLMESYLKWNNPDAAKKELHTLDSIWSMARTNLAGAKWAQTWVNWSLRRDAARRQLDDQPAARPAKPPKIN
jgi:hypothetical protein